MMQQSPPVVGGPGGPRLPSGAGAPPSGSAANGGTSRLSTSARQEYEQYMQHRLRMMNHTEQMEARVSSGLSRFQFGSPLLLHRF